MAEIGRREIGAKFNECWREYLATAGPFGENGKGNDAVQLVFLAGFVAGSECAIMEMAKALPDGN